MPLEKVDTNLEMGLLWWRGLVTEGGESPSEENPWFRAIGTEVKTENNML